MDFRAWLLDAQHAGNGNFQGLFPVCGRGGFDGALAGHFSLLDDNIYFDIPENALYAALRRKPALAYLCRAGGRTQSAACIS